MALSLFIAMSSSNSNTKNAGPLQGLKVLDFTRLLPGPLCTMMMADMGAAVIKIERPESPDYIRYFPPSFGNDSAYYLSLNRSKKSLAVDYKTDEGMAIILKLVATVDVLIEQFRPGVMELLGLGYEQLKAINPKLVYVSITGYGQTGPYAQKAGHDLNYIGYSGLLAVIGQKGGKPTIPGGQVADVAAGSYMALNGCLAALYAAEKTSKGQHVDVAMMDCVMPIASLPIGQYFATGESVVRGDIYLSGKLANYNVYECADGKHMALGALEPKFWELFCDIVNQPEWKPKTLAQGEELEQLKMEVTALFKSKPQAEWIALGKEYDCCLSPILEIHELENDPQIAHRQMLVKVETEDGAGLNTVGIPIKFSGTPAALSNPAPALGKDNKTILEGLGYDASQIDELKAKGIVSN